MGNKNIDDFFKKSAYKNEPQELKNYINELNQGVDPNRKTFTDRIGEFFKSVTEKASRYYPLRSRKDIVRKHSRFRRKLTTFFGRAIKRVMDRFNFEAGVDILDDTSVLYRRNKVNRNILMVTNAVFIIFTVIGNQKPNYIIIIIFGIIMLAINTTLGRIINEQPRTLVKQQMAMYFGSVYILIASVGVYVKLQISAVSLKVSDIGASNQFFTEAAMQNEFLARALTSATDTSIAQAGYILIYFALVVVALYQDPTLLRILFKWVLVVMTGIHILVLHQLYNYPSLTELYNYLVKTNFNVSIDIILRTLVLIVFYIALYSSVSIGEMMNNKRKEEFVKRSEMEKDFKAVVGDVFDESMRCINWGGRILSIGFTSGRWPQAPVNLILIKQIAVIGVRAGEYGRQDPVKGLENAQRLYAMAEAGEIDPYISHALPIEKAIEAMRLLEQREVVGKAVVTMNGYQM